MNKGYWGVLHTALINHLATGAGLFSLWYVHKAS